MVFAKIFVFTSFGNWLFSNFESGQVFWAFSKTCEIFAKKFGKKFGNFRPKMAIFGPIWTQFKHFWLQKSQIFSKNCENLQKTCSETRLEILSFFLNFLWVFLQKFPSFFRGFGSGRLPKLPKITKKWCSTPPILTRENSFRIKNQLESSVKSSECRALGGRKKYSVEIWIITIKGWF